MTVLSNNQSFVPFFSRPMKFVRGLDPLGLQNTSEATFALLLPGLNNVTGRIRYYSFYCWLLHEYAKRNGNTDPDEQKKFIRRAELIIALVNRSSDEEVSAIPGSNYANKLIKDENISVYDLHTSTYNADGSTEGTYWKYSLGAFGQYYLGSLLDIGLVAQREQGSGIFVRTQKKEGILVSGQDLALSFEANLSKKNIELFFSCIKKGKIKDESEHLGLANMIRGLFGVIRNPTAHEPKIKFVIEEEEALDVMVIISYTHKRLDKVIKK